MINKSDFCLIYSRRKKERKNKYILYNNCICFRVSRGRGEFRDVRLQRAPENPFGSVFYIPPTCHVEVRVWVR